MYIHIYIHMCIGVIGAANVFRVMSCVCPALALHMSNELLSKIRTDQVRNNRPQTIVMYGFLHPPSHFPYRMGGVVPSINPTF